MPWLAKEGMRRPEEVSDDSGLVRDVFLTEHQAWNHLRSNTSAGVKLSGRDVLRCRESLAAAERSAGDAAIEYAAVEGNYTAWLRG